MPNTISERIKEGLKIREMKQSELVEKTGIGKSSISTYISGSYEPKQRNIYKIAKALNVNEAWLMGLDVPMERINIVNTLEVTSDELKLLENYNKLNDLGKKEANKRVEELTYINKYIHNDEMCAAVAEEKADYLTPLAAHDKVGNFSEEDIQHDLDIMKDDKIWD